MRNMQLPLSRAALLAGFVVAWTLLPAICWTADEQPAELDRRVAKLVEQLGDADFAVREQARRELSRLGAPAYDALTAAENHNDPEVAFQAQLLVRQIRAQWTLDGAPLEVKRLLVDYELQEESVRFERLRALVRIPGDAAVEWLCRLVFFEPSKLVSKQAAMLLVTRQPQPEGANWDRQVRAIEKTLGRSAQPGAKWLRTYLLARRDPEKGLAEWAALAREEQALWRNRSPETSRQLVVQLWRQQIDVLDTLGRADDALAAVRNMALVEHADQASLAETVKYLAKRKAWSVIDEVAAKHDSHFAAQPTLMYSLAQVRLAQGDRDKANQTAQRALQVHPTNPDHHKQMGDELAGNGLFEWSDNEYRRSLEISGKGMDLAIRTRFSFGESLHDRQLDREAAEVFKGAVDAIDQDPNAAEALRGSQFEPSSIRARMHFLFACHYGAAGDVARHVEELDKAIKADPSDVEALIAQYKLKDQTDDRRNATLRRIEAALKRTRRDMESEPDLPTNYNQYAWLVANTTGENIDEAIRFSEKSIELMRIGFERIGQPAPVAGYLDTLAHCHYKKGDYAAAVKHQTEANQLEPHSQAIARQLAVFRKALEEQKSRTGK